MIATALTRIRRAAARVRGRFGPHGVILLYHRIAEDPFDPYGLCVSPAHFEEHLQVIGKVGRPMCLQDLVRRLRDGQLPDRAICVTFDDGYQDNLYAAKPILERYDVPATVFMTTGSVGRRREFWWDELERILLRTDSLPDQLELVVDGRTIELDLNGAASFSLSLKENKPWGVFDPNPPTPRHAVFQVLYSMFRSLARDEQTAALDRMLHWAETTSCVRETHRALEPHEVIALEDGGIVEIGAHTVNHPALSVQPVHVQRDEINECRSTLSQWLGHPVASFAYPYGLYSNETVAEVASAGFDFACACGGRAVRRDSEHLEIPRVDAPNDDGDVLERQLNTLFGR